MSYITSGPLNVVIGAGRTGSSAGNDTAPRVLTLRLVRSSASLPGFSDGLLRLARFTGVLLTTLFSGFASAFSTGSATVTAASVERTAF
jgi:hypothetical protein